MERLNRQREDRCGCIAVDLDRAVTRSIGPQRGGRAAVAAVALHHHDEERAGVHMASWHEKSKGERNPNGVASLVPRLVARRRAKR